MEQNIIQIDAHSNALSFDIINAKAISLKHKSSLLNLLNRHYKTLTLNDLFEHNEHLENLYILEFKYNNQIIAARQIYFVPFIKMAPQWAQDIAKHFNIKRFAIGSRAIVHPDFQNLQLGRRLIRKGNQYAFNHFKVNCILGSSTSIGAMALYMKLGAYMYKPSLSSLPLKPKKRVLPLFKRLTSSREFKLLRLDVPLKYIYFNVPIPKNMVPFLYQNPKPKNDKISAYTHCK